MAKLLYVTNTSLDGYTYDADGDFDWGIDEERHSFINDLLRPVGTHLYGRRMYEVMAVWESPPTEWPPHVQDFATLWQGVDKVVYWTTLENASTPKTRIERSFDPDEVRRLKAAASADMIIGGAQIASHAIRAGLVDEFQVFVCPVIVGGGQPWLPEGVRLNLELLDQRSFGAGAVYLRYGVRS